MALPTRPLAIQTACTTARSIALEVDGNNTGNKSLDTLGDTAFGGASAPHAMSEFEGFSSGSDATLNTYCVIGSDGSTSVRRCACVIYNPALAATQTWCLCSNWGLYAYADGNADTCTCFEIICNGAIKRSCSVNILGGGTTQNCSGFFSFGPIDNNDVVCYVLCMGSSSGGYSSYGNGSLCMHVSFGNVNGSVILGSPKGITAYSEDI